MTPIREAKFTKSDYETLSWWVGVHQDEDGNPLVVVDGKCIGALDSVIDHLVRVRDEMPGRRASLAERVARLEADVEDLRGDLPAKVVYALKQARRTNVLS